MSQPIFRFLAALAIAPGLAAFAAPAPAQDHACARVVEDKERLACYDAAFPRVIDPVAEAAAEAARREQAVRDYGLSQQQVQQRLPEEERENLPKRVESTIARITYRDTGQRVVTLENGQVWLLTEVTGKGPLKVGDAVAVRNAALGTHMMVTPGRVALRARRLN